MLTPTATSCAARAMRLRARVPLAPLALCAALGLAACDTPQGGSVTDAGYLATVPEEVAALAGPNQNLAAVQFREEDGCYWYRYDGPVESTMLPLRTAAGNPICIAKDAG